MAMSCQQEYSGSAAWCHFSTDDLGGGCGAEDFLSLLGDGHSSSDDLFELVWRGAAAGMEGQPSCNPLSSLPAAAAVPHVLPERLPAPPPPAPPSEAEMASWLFPIVCGEEFTGGGDAVVVAGGRRAWVDHDQNQMVPSQSGKESSDDKLQEERKTSTGGRRSYQHAEAHNLTEKRRRWKIKEKFKTLQQLVPGCNDNSNQASTLDQTIWYMKSLQQHMQAMSSFGCGMKPTSVAMYPVVQQAPGLPCWWQGGYIGAGMALGRSPPAIIPFCAHVSMGSPSPSPPYSHDV